MRHSWDVTPRQAIEIQQQLRNEIVTEDQFGDIRYIAGVDVGFEDRGRVTRAAVVVLALDGLGVVDQHLARQPTRFPYVPGLLSFREIPAVLEALEGLSTMPDLLLCDGHGIAHPRRVGIAAHLGLLTDIPSIGVGKSRLVGQHEAVPYQKGEWVPLVDKNELIGAVVRTREKVKPLFISPGHRVCIETSVDFVMRAVTRYRLPETTRLADSLASNRKARRQQSTAGS